MLSCTPIDFLILWTLILKKKFKLVIDAIISENLIFLKFFSVSLQIIYLKLFSF